MFIAGALGSAMLTAVYLWTITAGSYLLVFLTGVLLSGIVYSAANGVWPAFYGEMFPAQVRLSGTAIGTQIGFAIGGFAPTVAAGLAGGSTSGWVPVAVFTAVLCVLSALAAATARETYQTPMHELGRKRAGAVAPGVRTA